MANQKFFVKYIYWASYSLYIDNGTWELYKKGHVIHLHGKQYTLL